MISRNVRYNIHFLIFFTLKQIVFASVIKVKSLIFDEKYNFTLFHVLYIT